MPENTPYLGEPQLVGSEIAWKLSQPKAIYLLLMLEMSYLHPERRTEIVTRRRVIRSRLRSPLYWLKWLSVSAYFWVLAFDAPLVINLLKVRQPKLMVDKELLSHCMTSFA